MRRRASSHICIASSHICKASAAVTTAAPICILIVTSMRVPTLHYDQATTLLRSLASIGGVSNRTLEAQLKWIREHPEAPIIFASIYVGNQAVTTAWLVVRHRPLHPRAFIVYQVLDADADHQSISQSVLEPFRALVGTYNVETAEGATEDWTLVSLGKVVQHLCDESDAFKSLIREMVEKSGMPRASCHRICMTARSRPRLSSV